MNATLRLMLSALALGVALAATHANAAEDQKAKSETVTLKITGMTWGGCAGAVVTALMKVDGISDVTVDVKKSTASVTYDPAKTGPEKLVAAFKDTKFSASKAEDPDKSDKNKKGS